MGKAIKEDKYHVYVVTNLLDQEDGPRLNEDHVGKKIEAIALDNIGVDYPGKDVIKFNKGDKQFVPSFDKKEDGIWITNVVRKAQDGSTDVKLVGKYDETTNTFVATGEGFVTATIRIYLAK